MGLYDKADENKLGKINKDQLIDAIRNDLKFQMDQESENEPKILSDSDCEEPETAFKSVDS
jgi:hypothetical protein